jgi:hypothetical protein
MRLLMRRKQYLGENETPDRSPGLLQHHLYKADLHQMVLHRPIECTALTGHVSDYPVDRDLEFRVPVGLDLSSEFAILKGTDQLARILYVDNTENLVIQIGITEPKVPLLAEQNRGSRICTAELSRLTGSIAMYFVVN